MKKIILVLITTILLFGCTTTVSQNKIKPEIYNVKGWPYEKKQGIIYIEKDYALMVSPICEDPVLISDFNSEGYGEYNKIGVIIKYYNMTDTEGSFNTGDIVLTDNNGNDYSFDFRNLEVKSRDSIEQKFLINNTEYGTAKLNTYFSKLKYKDTVIDFNQEAETIHADQVPAKIKAYQDKITGEQN